MSGPFKVGDICILQNLQNHPQYNGEECIVVGGLEVRVGFNRAGEPSEAACYQVAGCGEIDLVLPHQLRPRKPPTTGEQSILSLFLTAPQRIGEPA